MMIKIVTLAGALALSMTSAGLAQTTGPSGQQDTNKPGMANPNANSGMSSGAMTNSKSMANPGSSTTTTPGSTMGPSGQTPKGNPK